jgi:cell division transport system permease protein
MERVENTRSVISLIVLLSQQAPGAGAFCCTSVMLRSLFIRAKIGAMSVFTNTKRIVKAGFINFWRNALVSLSAIFVMTVALFVVGSTMLSSVFLEGALNGIKDKVDVNIYFNADAPEEEIFIVKREMEALPEVASVEYISREQAIQNFKDRHSNDYLMTQALDELVENPLGAIVNIKAKDTAQYDAIAAHIKSVQDTAESGKNIIYSVNYAKNKAVIDKLTAITAGVNRVSIAVLFLLIGIAIVITFNTIRLAIYISREEIAVMRLVGANNTFVRGPFVVEGIMYGMVAAIVATALFYPATLWLKGSTQDFYGGVDLFFYYITNLNQIFLVILGTGVALGAISSYLAVRRYLKN